MKKEINWEKMHDLVPAIVQDATTQAVLMLGYMNQESYMQTLQTKQVTFYSRSKKKIWVKGETSGNWLKLVNISIDCDGDALLVRATPAGPTCHLGSNSCFGDSENNSLMFLQTLADIIASRVKSNADNSYTNQLINSGISRVAQKVGEEGVEVAIAAISEDNEKLCAELADLLYHVLVLLQARHLTINDVINVLLYRHQRK